MKTRKSVSKITKRIIKSFVASTLFPFLLIIFLPIMVFSSIYRNDVSKLSYNYLDSISDRVYEYFANIDRISLMVYYDDELIYFLKQKAHTEEQTGNYMYQKSLVMEELFSKLQTSKDGISGLILAGGNNLYYTSNNSKLGRVKDNYPWESEDWYQAALKGEGALVVVPHYQPEYLIKEDPPEIVSFVRVIQNIITKEPYAVIKMDVLYEDFSAIFGSFFNIPTKLILSNNDSRRIIFESVNIDLDPLFGKIQSIDEINPIVTNTKMITKYEKPLGKYNSTLTALLDFSRLKRKSQLIILVEIFVYLITFLIALYFNVRSNRNIVLPIREIKEVFKQTAAGNFNARYVGDPKWELQELGYEINSMISELGLTLEKNELINKKNMEAEYKILSSQIQPHFIFNILNSFITQLNYEKYYQLEEGLYALSSMLRYVLRDEMYTTIKEEIEFLKSYCLLQRDRFSNRFDFEFSLGRECEEIIIPRLILQPFVENSITHGIEPINRFCLLEIKVKQRNPDQDHEETEILIQDNGFGFSTAKINYENSIGVKNCQERMTLVYPHSSITITSKENVGTTVKICFRRSSNEDYYC